jgi:hypothetical protein
MGSLAAYTLETVIVDDAEEDVKQRGFDSVTV